MKNKIEIELSARAGHEVIRAYCVALGDTSHPPWEEADKRPAMIGAGNIIEHDFNAEQSHQAWMTERLASGWTYGPTKHEGLKQHPCLVAYDQLPVEQQIKDELFVQVVKATVSALWRRPQ